MSTLDQIAGKIIKEQELIIGPIAWQEALKVPGLKVIDQKSGEVVIEGPDGKTVINTLVSQYEHFFGRAALEACKDAASSLVADLQASEIPSSLQ
jgi:hypothetical protein